LRLLLQDDRVVPECDRQVKFGHPGASVDDIR